MHKGYFGDTGEQVHFREIGKGSPPLICLPPAPHTGAYFETLMPYLADNHHVIALDYPGYGGADKLISTPSIEGYAKRLLAALSEHLKIDLLGFHTGNLVALEMALQDPSKIRNIVMIDVPYFEADTRAAYIEKFPSLAAPDTLTADFDKSVTHRHTDVHEDRAISQWVESLRSGRFRNDAFRAAFSYPCEESFPRLKKHVTVIATQSGLLEPSRRAAKILPHATLVERLDITTPVFEAHSETLTTDILQALTA